MTRPILTLLLVLIGAMGAMGAMGAGMEGLAQRAVFSSRVESVRVDVMVTDGGRPVHGLQPSDFDVLDNGVRQQVETVSFDEVPLNVVLTLDMSGSLAGDRLRNLRTAGGAVLDGLTKMDQAALVTFRSAVTLGSPLTRDIPVVRSALEAALPDGDTSLVDGLYAATLIGETDVGRALVIAFSDGLDTSSWLAARSVLDTAKRSDVVVYGVSAGRGKSDFLSEMASITGGRVFEVEKTANLSAIFSGILQEFRQRYLISYTPRGVAATGWHQLTVRVKRAGAVKARTGYLAGP